MLYAEIYNATDEVKRYLEVADSDYVAPDQKYGANKETRFVIVDTAPSPSVDQSVFSVAQTTDVKADSLLIDWSVDRKSDSEVLNAIDAEVLRRINGLAGIMLVVRVAAIGKLPTAQEQAEYDRIVSILNFSDTLKANVSKIDSIAGANWP